MKKLLLIAVLGSVALSAQGQEAVQRHLFTNEPMLLSPITKGKFVAETRFNCLTGLYVMAQAAVDYNLNGFSGFVPTVWGSYWHYILNWGETNWRQRMGSNTGTVAGSTVREP